MRSGSGDGVACFIVAISIPAAGMIVSGKSR
jgi:hypothetical protein